MGFTPISPEIKERIISAHLSGQGRNAIDRELKAQGIKVSHGSISNIINKYRRKHDASYQCNESVCNDERTIKIPIPTPTQKASQDQQPEVATTIITNTQTDMNTNGSPSLTSSSRYQRVGLATDTSTSTSTSNKPDRPVETLVERDLKSDVDLEKYLITNTEDFEKNGYSEDTKSLGYTSAPLGWFVGSGTQNDYDATSSKVDDKVSDTRYEHMTSPKSTVRYMSDKDVNTATPTIEKDRAIDKTSTIKTKNETERLYRYHPQSSSSTS